MLVISRINDFQSTLRLTTLGVVMYCTQSTSVRKSPFDLCYTSSLSTSRDWSPNEYLGRVFLVVVSMVIEGGSGRRGMTVRVGTGSNFPFHVLGPDWSHPVWGRRSVGLPSFFGVLEESGGRGTS